MDEFEKFFPQMVEEIIFENSDSIEEEVYLFNLDQNSFFLDEAALFAIRYLDDRLAKKNCPKRTKNLSKFFGKSLATIKRKR